MISSSVPVQSAPHHCRRRSQPLEQVQGRRPRAMVSAPSTCSPRRGLCSRCHPALGTSPTQRENQDEVTVPNSPKADSRLVIRASEELPDGWEHGLPLLPRERQQPGFIDGRFSGFRVRDGLSFGPSHLPAAPSRSGSRPMACGSLRPRLQRRGRSGLSPVFPRGSAPRGPPSTLASLIPYRFRACQAHSGQKCRGRCNRARTYEPSTLCRAAKSLRSTSPSGSVSKAPRQPSAGSGVTSGPNMHSAKPA